MQEINAENFRLVQSLTVSINDAFHVVPAGFVTDLGSVPRLPIAYLLTANKGRKSCVLHDNLYGEGNLSRSICDEILLHALKAEGVGIIARRLMYWGVRAGGGSHYGNK